MPGLFSGNVDSYTEICLKYNFYSLFTIVSTYTEALLFSECILNLSSGKKNNCPYKFLLQTKSYKTGLVWHKVYHLYTFFPSLSKETCMHEVIVITNGNKEGMVVHIKQNVTMTFFRMHSHA